MAGTAVLEGVAHRLGTDAVDRELQRTGREKRRPDALAGGLRERAAARHETGASHRQSNASHVHGSRPLRP